MSELLYNRSKAVAALNHIDGFEPMEFARVIENEGMEPQLYLDVKFRKLWFRLCNPNGKISKKIISLNENMAIVEAKVYLDKDDQEDRNFGLLIRSSVINSWKRRRQPQPDALLQMPDTGFSSLKGKKMIPI